MNEIRNKSVGSKINFNVNRISCNRIQKVTSHRNRVSFSSHIAVPTLRCTVTTSNH